MADLTTLPQPATPDPNSIGGTIGSIIDLVHGANGNATDVANGIADVADPFRQQRPQYQTELNTLLKDPSSFTMDPGTQYAINQGTSAIQRAANAQGVSRGGSVVADIGQFVTGTAQQAYEQRIKDLMTLSGATTGSPAAAAGALAQGQKNREGDIAGGLSGLDGLFRTLFGTSNTGGLATGAINAIGRLFGGGAGSLNDGSGGFQIPGGIGGLFGGGNGPSISDVINGNVGPGDDVTGSIGGAGDIPWITGGGDNGGIFSNVNSGVVDPGFGNIIDDVGDNTDWSSIFGGP